MADHFEITGRRPRGHNVAINRKCIFQRPPRHKVADFLSGIRHASHPKQMALLANAVPRRRLQLRWIHDRLRARVGQVLFHRPMAAFARNRLRREHRRAVFIQRPRNMQRISGVAQQAFFRDRPREIRIGLILISRRKIVSPPAFVVGHRRLKQMSADIHQIPARMFARANHKIDAVFALVAAIFPALVKSRRRGMHGDGAAMRRRCPVRLVPRAPQGVRHRRARKSLYLAGMAHHAAMRARGFLHLHLFRDYFCLRFRATGFLRTRQGNPTESQ